MKYSKIILLLFLLGVTGITISSCQNDDHNKTNENDYIENVEGYIIGFDQCSIAPNDQPINRGYVIALTEASDTLVTYDIPNDLYGFPDKLFAGYVVSFLFPEVYRDDYKIRFSYRYAAENEKIYYLCQGIIYLADYNRYVKDRQIIVKDIVKIT